MSYYCSKIEVYTGVPELHVKAKMRNIHEEKFWEGKSIDIEHLDSAERRKWENKGIQLYNTNENVIR